MPALGLFSWSGSLARGNPSGHPSPSSGSPTPGNLGCISFPAKGRAQDPPPGMAPLSTASALCSPSLHHQDHKGQEDTYRPFPKTQQGAKCPKTPKAWAGGQAGPGLRVPATPMATSKGGRSTLGPSGGLGKVPGDARHWSLPWVHMGQN